MLLKNHDYQLQIWKLNLQTMISKHWQSTTLVLLLIASMLLLSACSATSKPLQLIMSKPEIAIPKPQNPRPIIMRPVIWQVFSDGKTAKVCMSIKSYENLSKNMAGIVTYMHQQRAVVNYYRSD